MHQQQSAQKTKAADSVIARVRCLLTLYTNDTDADVCALQHSNIVCPVTDGQAARARNTVLD